MTTVSPMPPAPDGSLAGIRIRLLLFAAIAEAADVAAGEGIELDLPADATIDAIWTRLATDRPELHAAIAPWINATTPTINERVVRRDAMLTTGDVVALLPPVSGG